MDNKPVDLIEELVAGRLASRHLKEQLQVLDAKSN